MTTIIKYRIYCNTDDKWEETWRSSDDPTLTVCPVNNTHEINGSSLQELETISESVIKIDEEGTEHSTGKHFRSESYTIIAPTGTSLHQYTWEKPISVCEIKFGASKEHFGDIVNNKIGGHIPVGYLTASVETGDS